MEGVDKMSDVREFKSDISPKRMFTVAFNTCTYPNAVEPVDVRAGATVAKPEGLEKPSCEFVDWYVDRDLRRPYDFNTPVMADMVLYAKWKFIQGQHEIYFCDYPAYPDTTTVVVEHGQPLKKPRDPEKKGYTFIGWYLTDVPNEAFYYLFDTPVTQSLSLFPMYSESERPEIPIRPIK